MKYVVALTKTTLAYGEWIIEAESIEAAEMMAALKLETENPEEIDVTFCEWEVSFGETREADEQDED